MIGCVHTRGRINPLDSWERGCWCEFMSYCRQYCRSSGQANRLGKIVFPDSKIRSDDLFVEKFVRPVCTSNDLFVWDDFSFQTICSSSNVKTDNDCSIDYCCGRRRHFNCFCTVQLQNKSLYYYLSYVFFSVLNVIGGLSWCVQIR